MSFPPNFAWGAATASYQIEGAVQEHGRGLSVWDDFCTKPGKVYNGHSGAVACDHYHRYLSDVAEMQSVGLQAYRFSISWSRVLPTGEGKVNEVGLAFYDRLVDELLAAGIEPWVTIFHWDYPLDLYRRGGWLNPESPKWFAEYTRVVVDRLSDRVSRWITLNEPQCFVGLGHHRGIHAPGDMLPLDRVLLAAHHALLAHGQAVRVIRERAKKKPYIGWAPTGDVPIPATDSSEDVAAARELFWAVPEPGVWNQSWWNEPVLKGQYPEHGLKLHGSAVPKYTTEDMRVISEPLDFLGLNIYHGVYCRRGPDGQIERLPWPDGFPQTHNNWNVTPAALRWGPVWGHHYSKLPIVITESGMAGHDWVSRDGGVHDSARIDYLDKYLRQLHRAVQDGVPVEGYFVWSWMDNFEWAEGYRYRFGLVHVDYATQKRTPKDSARWYADVIRTNGGVLVG